MTTRQAFFAPSEVVAAADAVGRISGDTLAAYPPGIPNVLPGEVISAELIAFFHKTVTVPGGYVRGAVDEKVTQMRVIHASEDGS